MRRSKKSLGRAILVSFLSASMVMTTPASVFAKTFVENQTETIEGDVNDGIKAPAKSNVTVNGSVNVQDSNQHVDADNATVKVTGNVNTCINADNGSTVTVGGNVKEGVRAENNSTVIVAGTVNTAVDSIDGAHVSVNKDVNGDINIYDGKVSIGGNVTGDVDQWDGNLNIQGNLNGGFSSTIGTSHIAGNITSNINTKYGGYAVGTDGGTVTVTGNVSLDNKKGGEAVSVGEYGNATNVVIGGNVSAKSTDTYITRVDGSDSEEILKKDVYTTGVDVNTGSDTDITVKGNVDVSSNAFASGIHILKENNYSSDEGGESTIKNAVINVTTGSINVNAPKEVTKVNGKHTTSTATAIEVESVGNNAEINVVVNGDAISSADNAISICNNGNGKTNIVVDGTVKSSKNGIVITNYDDEKATVEITTWKIEGDTTNNVLVNKQTDDGRVKDEAATKKQSENINYIIRHEGTISLEGTRPITVNGNKFETARETEKLTIHVKVDDEKKYRVDRVEGGAATATKNADGSWTLIVPKNGGVDIRAVLVAIEQTKHNSSSSSGGGSSSTRPGVNNASTGMITTTPEGATVQTNVTKNDNSTVTTAAVRIGTTTANVSSAVSDQNGTKVTVQNADGNLAGASFKGVGQISADGATLVKEDGTTAKMAPGMLLSIENADGTSVGCFMDATGKTIATGNFEVYYMLGTDGKLHAHFVNPQGYFMTGIQVINGMTVTFNATGEMVSVL